MKSFGNNSILRCGLQVAYKKFFEFLLEFHSMRMHGSSSIAFVLQTYGEPMKPLLTQKVLL